MKTARDLRIAADRELLHKLFPNTFADAGEKHKKPLKIGISADLLARDIRDENGNPVSNTRLRDALRDYCMGPKYQRALLATSVRYDLDGNPAGVVTEDQRVRAESILRLIEKRWKRRQVVKKSGIIERDQGDGGTVFKEAA